MIQKRTNPLFSLARFAQLFALVALVVFQHSAFAAEPKKPVVAGFKLADQNDAMQEIKFPRERPLILVVSDHKGSAGIADWITPLAGQFRPQLDFFGVADLSPVPKPLRAKIRSYFQKGLTYPVMLDWEGSVVDKFNYKKKVPNLFLINKRGEIVKSTYGLATDAVLKAWQKEIELLLPPVAR